jgi:hypothetical protein
MKLPGWCGFAEGRSCRAKTQRPRTFRRRALMRLGSLSRLWMVAISASFGGTVQFITFYSGGNHAA